MLHVDGITHTASSIGRAGMMASKLPQHAAKVHHALNNFASRSETRLLHVGHSMPYVLWENEHVKAHWIDDDFETAPPMAPDLLSIPADVSGFLRATPDFNFRDHMTKIEIAFIRGALSEMNGSVSGAARVLGLQRTTLIEKMRKYSIDREEA